MADIDHEYERRLTTDFMTWMARMPNRRAYRLLRVPRPAVQKRIKVINPNHRAYLEGVLRDNFERRLSQDTLRPRVIARLYDLEVKRLRDGWVPPPDTAELDQAVIDRDLGEGVGKKVTAGGGSRLGAVIAPGPYSSGGGPNVPPRLSNRGPGSPKRRPFIRAGIGAHTG